MTGLYIFLFLEFRFLVLKYRVSMSAGIQNRQFKFWFNFQQRITEIPGVPRIPPISLFRLSKFFFFFKYFFPFRIFDFQCISTKVNLGKNFFIIFLLVCMILNFRFFFNYPQIYFFSIFILLKRDYLFSLKAKSKHIFFFVIFSVYQIREWLIT